MNFDQYQAECETTCLPTARNIPYLIAGLASEAGEVCSVFKKGIRDNRGAIPTSQMHKELGDVLWYVAMLCNIFRMDMGEIAAANIGKLKDRKERGTLSGSGDER